MRFTSIGTEISELDRCRHELDQVVTSYRAIAVDVAESALFAVAQTTPEGREKADRRLRTLAAIVCNAPASDFPRCTEQLREILHECSAEASAYVSRLEQERAGIERALAEFTSSLDRVGDGSEQAIRQTVERLRTLSRSPEGRFLREALRSAADSVERNFDQLQKHHRLASTNFQREIRSLQMRVSPPGESPGPDACSGLTDRSGIEGRLLSIQPGLAWIVLLRLRGLRMVLNQPGPEAVSQLLSILTARARNTFPLHTVLGRWSPEEFIAVVPPPDAGVSPKAFCRGVLDGLYDPWICTVGGRSFRPAIEVSACVLETNARESSAQLLEKIDTSLQRM